MRMDDSSIDMYNLMSFNLMFDVDEYVDMAMIKMLEMNESFMNIATFRAHIRSDRYENDISLIPRFKIVFQGNDRIRLMFTFQHEHKTGTNNYIETFEINTNIEIKYSNSTEVPNIE